jgi:hypothetical protein
MNQFYIFSDTTKTLFSLISSICPIISEVYAQSDKALQYQKIKKARTNALSGCLLSYRTKTDIVCYSWAFTFLGNEIQTHMTINILNRNF